MTIIPSPEKLLDDNLGNLVDTILSQTNSNEAISVVLKSEQNREQGQLAVVRKDGSPGTASACFVDTFHLYVAVSGRQYEKLLMADAPRIQDPDSNNHTHFPEALEAARNNSGYCLRRILKSGRKVLFTSDSFGYHNKEATKKFAEELCPEDKIKISLALQYEFLKD